MAIFGLGLVFHIRTKHHFSLIFHIDMFFSRYDNEPLLLGMGFPYILQCEAPVPIVINTINHSYCSYTPT
jgi:hypothetical protein